MFWLKRAAGGLAFGFSPLFLLPGDEGRMGRMENWKKKLSGNLNSFSLQISFLKASPEAGILLAA